jgi:hypothetical protein
MEDVKSKRKPSAFWSPLGVLVAYAASAEAVLITPLLWGDSIGDRDRSHILWLATAVIGLTLLLFSVLVIFYTDRLYAPFEYRSDEAFERVSRRWKMSKQSVEAAEILSEEASETTELITEQSGVEKGGSKGISNTTVEGSNKKTWASSSTSSRRELIREVVDIEHLAFKYINKLTIDSQSSVMPHKVMRDLSVIIRPDMLIQTPSAYVVCEVKYTRAAKHFQNFVRSALMQISESQMEIAKGTNKVVRGLIILIHDYSDNESLRSDSLDRAKRLVSHLDIETNLVVLSKAELADLVQDQSSGFGQDYVSLSIKNLLD